MVSCRANGSAPCSPRRMITCGIFSLDQPLASLSPKKQTNMDALNQHSVDLRRDIHALEDQLRAKRTQLNRCHEEMVSLQRQEQFVAYLNETWLWTHIRDTVEASWPSANVPQATERARLILFLQARKQFRLSPHVVVFRSGAKHIDYVKSDRLMILSVEEWAAKTWTLQNGRVRRAVTRFESRLQADELYRAQLHTVLGHDLTANIYGYLCGRAPRRWQSRGLSAPTKVERERPCVLL